MGVAQLLPLEQQRAASDACLAALGQVGWAGVGQWLGSACKQAATLAQNARDAAPAVRTPPAGPLH